MYIAIPILVPKLNHIRSSSHGISKGKEGKRKFSCSMQTSTLEVKRLVTKLERSLRMGLISLYSISTTAVLAAEDTVSFIQRRTVPLSCSWRVTTYVGKPSAAGQPTRPTQPFILSRSINWVVRWYRTVAQVAPSGECLRGYGRVRLKRLLSAVCVVLAAYARAKPCCCWLYLACVPVLVYLSSTVLRVSCCDAYRSGLSTNE